MFLVLRPFGEMYILEALKSISTCRSTNANSGINLAMLLRVFFISKPPILSC